MNDPLWFLLLSTGAFFTGLAGNMLGLLVVGAFSPKKPGSEWTLFALMASAANMAPLKMVIALITTMICVFTLPPNQAIAWSLGITCAAAFLFTTILGLTLNRSNK